MQGVADTDLPLDLRVRQVGHDGAALHVGPARRHVPRGHAHPQLTRDRESNAFSSDAPTAAKLLRAEL